MRNFWFLAARETLRSGMMAAALVASVGEALAQSSECARLQQQIALGPQGNPAEAEKYIAAAQRQRGELDRSVAYARSIGCGRKQFLFFGDAPPAQCPALEQQIARMQSNYEQLTAQAQQYSGEAQRRALIAQYNNSCRAPSAQPQQARSGGLFDGLFGSSPRSDSRDLRDVPIGPSDGTDIMPPEDTTPRGGSKAVCVRTCDGGFFPVSYSASRGSLGSLEDQCRALCPNAETQLFTYSPNRDIDSAISITGQPYSSLANAGKYRTKFDAACTCKPPNQGWAEALGDAERLLGRGRDTIVTPQRAEELSRAKPATQPKTSAGAANSSGKTTASAAPVSAAPVAPVAAAPAPASDPSSADPKKKVRVVGPQP